MKNHHLDNHNNQFAKYFWNSIVSAVDAIVFEKITLKVLYVKALLLEFKGSVQSFMAYLAGYYTGKTDEQNQQHEEEMQDALETQKRCSRRMYDGDDTVVKRMHKYPCD